VYILKLILFKEFLTVVCEEIVTILDGKPFQTFMTRVRAAVVDRQLEGVTTGYGAVAIGSHKY